MRTETPFHDGEIQAQELAGARQSAARVGAIIHREIPDGADHFLGYQRMAIVSSLDADGNVWASLLLGRAGFLSVADPRHIVLDTSRLEHDSGDPLWVNIAERHEIGLVVIDLATRRRFRVNGRLLSHGDGVYRLEVEEAYGNCPKFIQRRELEWSQSQPAIISSARHGKALEPDHLDLLAKADTLFVASLAERGADASHRGGSPGFVTVLADGTTLRVPDYPGNNMFNTLGNFLAYPRAGLLVPDFDNGRILQVVGRPEVRWSAGDPEGASGGTGRFWDLHVEGWRETSLEASPAWNFLDASPFNP